MESLIGIRRNQQRRLSVDGGRVSSCLRGAIGSGKVRTLETAVRDSNEGLGTKVEDLETVVRDPQKGLSGRP